MWLIILKSVLALVSIFTGGAIFYKYIKDNKILVFLAGSVSILSALYLFSEIRRDIDKLVVEKKVEVKVEATSTSKWFSPTNKEVTWKKAKELCKDNGGRLPTIEELKKVVIDCGGEMKDDNSAEWKRNKNNDNYQSCYEEKGFKASYYWSSTSFVGFEDGAWVVGFGDGDVYWYGKNYNYSVRCVRAGQ